MVFQFASVPALILVSLTSMALLTIKDWRARIAILAIQYLGVFFLTGISLPVGLSVSILVAGWMAGAVLGMVMLSLHTPVPTAQDSEGPAPKPRRNVLRWRLEPRTVFYFLAGILVMLIALALTPEVLDFAPGIAPVQALGALVLMGIGLLQISLEAQPLSFVIGLLSILSGFEILYFTIEPSLLLLGLIALATLGLALVGAYLLTAPLMEGE